MAGILKGIGSILGIGGSKEAQTAQVAQQAQSLKNGAVEVLIDTENHYIIFQIAERRDLQPIVLDLRNNQILNANLIPAPPA
jgi:hypothetical protein